MASVPLDAGNVGISIFRNYNPNGRMYNAIMSSKSGGSRQSLQQEWNRKPQGQKPPRLKENEAETVYAHVEAGRAECQQRLQNTLPLPWVDSKQFLNQKMDISNVDTGGQKSKTKKCLKSPWVYFSQMKRLQKPWPPNRCQ